MNSVQTGTVLAVDDERDVVELYAAWLRDEYTVRTATGGHEALRQLDQSVDVVLLDRHMPDLSGDEVLTAIRKQELDCRVAMVTGVDPGFDIIQMGFDDYVMKPVDAEELRNLVRSLVARSTYDSSMREYFELVSKWAVLNTKIDETERKTNPAFAILERRMANLRSKVDNIASGMDECGFEAVLRDIDDASGTFDFDDPSAVSTTLSNQGGR